MNVRWLLIAALTVGCASREESEPAISAEQAQAAFAGTWSGTLTRAGQPDSVLTLTLRMANPVPTVKCGNHVLSTKCMDTTTVQLIGTLTTSDGAFTSTDVRGNVMVFGAASTNGQLEIATPRLFGAYRDGAIHDGTLDLPLGRAQFKLLTRR